MSSQLLLFNKPYQVLCQFTGEAQDKTLAHYIDMKGFYAAGRLDKNSEGLLILTNDGKLQHQIAHPNANKRKYYWVQVEGNPTDADLEPLIRGLEYRGLSYLKAQVTRTEEPAIWERNPPIRVRKSIPTSWLEIVLCEGKNHQIRHMTASIGYPTLRLIRHRIGDWHLGALKPGEFSLL